MSVSPKKYISNGQRRIKAIKVTEKNFVEVLNYALKHGANIVKREANDRNVAKSYIAPGGDVSNQRIYLHLQGKGVRVAHVGDYVALEINAAGETVDGRIFIVKQEIFENNKYTLIKS